MTIQVGYKKPSSLFPYMILGMFLGVALFWLWYLQIEPIYSYVNPLISLIAVLTIPVTDFFKSILPGFSNLGQSLVAYFNQNPIAALTAGVAVAGTLYTVYNKIQSARKEAVSAQQIADAQNLAVQTSNKLTQVQTEKEKLEKQVETLKGTDQKEYLDNLEAQISQKDSQITELKATVNYQNTLIENLKTKTVEKTVVK